MAKTGPEAFNASGVHEKWWGFLSVVAALLRECGKYFGRNRSVRKRRGFGEIRQLLYLLVLVTWQAYRLP